MARVLVVDDESSIRDLITDTLFCAGHDVMSEPSGTHALAALAEALPDVVVLDVMMPGMSGVQVLRAIRADERTAALPVILLTARVDDDSTWEGWAAGANLYLPKPFDPADLQDRVDQLVAETQRDIAELIPAQVDRGALLSELRSLTA